MKKAWIILAAVIFAGGQMLAQEETLLGDGKISQGGFGGPVVKFTHIHNTLGVLVGGHGGWIVNHTFVIGGGGYGLVNNIRTVKVISGEEQLLTFGYGGLELHYINQSNNLVHYTVSILLGGGGVGYRSALNDYEWDWDRESNAFFVFEPGVRVMLNVTNFFRIGAGASYRVISGVDMDNFKNNDFSGPSTELVFKFGKF